jgi:uncharacterized protein (TIGR00730 family)
VDSPGIAPAGAAQATGRAILPARAPQRLILGVPRKDFAPAGLRAKDCGRKKFPLGNRRRETKMQDDPIVKTAADSGGHIPEPPHPRERHTPLPNQAPHGAARDAATKAALERMEASPTYRQADEDLDFLQEPETRGIRLELEYLKAETRLAEHRIAHTVVVFGGTRLVEKPDAERVLAERARELAADPDNSDLIARHRIAERLVEKCHYYDMAREFGRIVGRCSDRAHNGRIVIMTGGGPGIMEAANRGAAEVGARSVGLNITLPHEQFPNPYITPELCFRFHYFALRKLHFALRARALVVFPGGFGTLDELFELLTLSQTRKMPPVPIVLACERYWSKVFNLEFLVEEGMIDPEDAELFWYADSAEAIWRGILGWYEKRGEPLVG